MRISINHFIEIRTLNIKPDKRDEFHRLYIEKALPLLKQWNFDVVAYDQCIGNKNPTNAWGRFYCFFFNLDFGSATCLFGTRGL